MIYNIDLIRKQLLHTLHHRAEMEEALIQYGQVSGHIFLVKKREKICKNDNNTWRWSTVWKKLIYKENHKNKSKCNCIDASITILDIVVLNHKSTFTSKIWSCRGTGNSTLNQGMQVLYLEYIIIDNYVWKWHNLWFKDKCRILKFIKCILFLQGKPLLLTPITTPKINFFFLIKCNTVKRLDNHKEIKMHKLPPQHCNQIFHSKLSLLMIKTELGKSTICRFNGSVAC